MLDKKGREPGQLSGLTDSNKRAIIQTEAKDDQRANFKIGQFVAAKVVDASQNTLFCEPIETLGV